MPELTLEEQTLALAIVAGVALLCLLLVVAVMIRMRRVRREYMLLRGETGDHDLLASVGDSVGRTRAVEKKMSSIITAQEDLAAVGRLALQRFAVVRYDAFEDMGGQLSFSAALLDDYGDGIVITSINGRTETRTYAKPVRETKSRHNLSDEERDAIDAAVAGAERGAGSAGPQDKGGAGSAGPQNQPRGSDEVPSVPGR
ncbi:MAG: DUF4446 family protein [Actinomycetota bacterium]|nr:DUF4446 family protein [Actinomycetota bacterium]